MKKLLLIFATVLLFVFNLAIPTTVLAQEKGPYKPKEWKGSKEEEL